MSSSENSRKLPKKNCCNKVKHHYKFTSFPMIDYSPIWQSIIQFFTFHSIHKPKTVETDLFSKASKFLNASPKIIRKPFLTRESQHCHILAYPLRHLCYKQNHSWSIWTAKLSTILCLLLMFQFFRSIVSPLAKARF